jgi:hypothetical protein
MSRFLEHPFVLIRCVWNCNEHYVVVVAHDWWKRCGQEHDSIAALWGCWLAIEMKLFGVEWLWQIYWWAFLVVLSGNWLNQNGRLSSFYGLHGKLSTSCSSHSLCQCDVNGLSDWLDSSECVWSLEVFGEGVLNIRCAELLVNNMCRPSTHSFLFGYILMKSLGMASFSSIWCA